MGQVNAEGLSKNRGGGNKLDSNSCRKSLQVAITSAVTLYGMGVHLHAFRHVYLNRVIDPNGPEEYFENEKEAPEAVRKPPREAALEVSHLGNATLEVV